MFDAFRLQLPQGCCHRSLLQHSLLSSFAFRRTGCPGVRRRAWAVRAAWSGNEKTEKEIAAHFAMYNRKGGEDRAKHAAGQNGQLKDCKHVLPLFTQYKNLPPDGKVLTEDEELCNPEERSCGVPMYVWERKCFACSGTGFVRSSSRSRRGRGTTGVCPTCIGLGFVRCTSSRVVPELNNGSGPHFTIMRPRDEEDYDSE